MEKSHKELVQSTLLLVTLVLAFSVGGIVSAQPEDTQPARGREQILEQIGEEAMQVLRETVQAMREAGNSFEEIREFIRNYLTDLGVELPEPQGEGMRHRGFKGQRGRMFRNRDCPLETPEETTGSA